MMIDLLIKLIPIKKPILQEPRKHLGTRLAVCAFLLMAGTLFSACSGPDDLPRQARKALEETIRSLPGVAASDRIPSGLSTKINILRAWPAVKPAEETTPWEPDMQTWCVEVSVPEGLSYTPGSDKMIWIITRPDSETDWGAALLMAMSSSWPYEACGVLTPY